MRTRAFALLAALVCVVATLPALAQVCTPQLRGFGTGPMDYSPDQRAYVSTLLPFDEDGDGPLPESLIVAGQFMFHPGPSALAPMVVAARYRDGQWTAMHAGLPLTTSGSPIRALAVQDFSSVGGPGRSLYCVGPGTNGWIYRWTGTQWVSVGSLGGGPGYTLLATTDEQGPVLLAGGFYTGSVIAWRGSGAWTQYAPLNTTLATHRLRILDDGTGPGVFAVGNFNDNGRGVRCITKLVNGQWTPVTPLLETGSNVTDITVFDAGQGPELYIAGQFNVPGMMDPGVARLRGGVWQPINNTRLSRSSNAVGPTFFTLDEGGGPRLYVGGFLYDFNQWMGLVRLGATGWEAAQYFTTDNNGPARVHAMARFDDGGGVKTYTGGVFQYARATYGISQATGLGTPCESLVRAATADDPYESVATGLGPWLTGPTWANQRYDLSVISYGGAPRLMLGGGFERAGGRPMPRAALFDGAQFTALRPPTNIGAIYAIQRSAVFTFNGQERIVAYAPSSSLGPICTWDGVQWARLTVQPGGAQCYALWSRGGHLFALMDTGLWRYNTTSWLNVGSMTATQATLIGDAGEGERLFFVTVYSQGPGVYQFDGATVSLWAATTTTVISGLGLHDDGGGIKMYIAGSGVSGGIQRRENGAWAPLSGGGLSLSNNLISMASFDDGEGPGLYVAGVITAAGGQPVNGFARWRGGAWSPVTPYVAQQNQGGLTRTSMAVFGDRLYIAGDFSNIGGVNADRLAFIEACDTRCRGDYNGDGDFGTDQDIEAFFACLGGVCCPRCTADFNGDGDFGTDGDIEAFFRVLGGGSC